MTRTRHSLQPLFSQVDVTAENHLRAMVSSPEEPAEWIHEMLAGQNRTNELLEELIAMVAANHRQRTNELNEWRKAHPTLAKACRQAAEALTHVQVEFLERLTEEINDTGEELLEGEFLLNEFVDRYGPRLAHLHGVIHVLSQLSGLPNPANSRL